VYRADRTHLLGNPSIVQVFTNCRAYVIVQSITKLIVVLLTAGLIDCLASDNHGDRRSLAAARLWLEELGATDHAQILTHGNASRLLADEPTLPVLPLPLDRGVFHRLRELLFGRR